MMALSKKRLRQEEPDEIETLLPWHAAGTLGAPDARRVEEALARKPELARQFAVIREEYVETIALNEGLGAPSMRAMQNLFAAIDAEPARERDSSRRIPSRLSGFLASLSPRTLAWSAGLGALALLLQAGAIGALLLRSQPATYQTASLSMGEPSNKVVTRSLGGEQPLSQALVSFKPEAEMTEITALLDAYQASIVGGVQRGTFRLQFDGPPMTKGELINLIGKLQRESIVNLAVAVP
jgi:hypothetical protein